MESSRFTAVLWLAIDPRGVTPLLVIIVCRMLFTRPHIPSWIQPALQPPHLSGRLQSANNLDAVISKLSALTSSPIDQQIEQILYERNDEVVWNPNFRSEGVGRTIFN